MSITKSSFHERGTKGTLRKNDGNCKNKAHHKCMYMFKAFSAVAVAAANTREFKMPLRRRHKNVKTQFGKISKTTTLHVHHAFFYIFLPSLHDYDVNCLISRFVDNVNIRRRIAVTLCIPGYFSEQFISRRVRQHKT